MSDPRQAVQDFLSKNADRYVDDLKELLRIPSISADSKYKGDVRKAGEWVHQKLAAAGLDAKLEETPGHPIVYAEWTKKPGRPTVMVYGHYDVQPPDPLNEWTTPPFEPTVRDGKLYARGATDDKGQMLTHALSVEAWLKAVGELPVNVKFVIEGEEEVGSNNLEHFLEGNRDRLKSDVAVISDTSQYAPGIPAVTYGLRGIIAAQVTFHGPKQDLHSGVFGGSIANPVTALAAVIGKLHDDEGRIQIPGFYDDVADLTAAERKEWAQLPFEEKAYLAALGTDAAWGEKGFTTLERRWARPTCDINGITGGYQGEGPKTIIPAKATAKITCRLVPNQNPEKVIAALRKFFETHKRPGIRMEFQEYHGAPATVCDLNSPWMAAARDAIAAGFEKPPVMIREGGTIPVVGTFKKVLGVDTLLLGWGQNTDNLHGPNEHFSLDDFQRGIRSSAHLWAALAGKK